MLEPFRLFRGWKGFEINQNEQIRNPSNYTG